MRRLCRETFDHAAIRASAVADQLADECRASVDGGQRAPVAVPDNFLYVFKPGPTGPGSAPPPKDGRLSPSAPASLPLQAAALGLARTCQWASPADNVTRHQPTTPRVLMAGYPKLVAHAVCRPALGLGLPHRPASNHERCGPARPASRASRSAGEQARPLTRTDPNLTAAAIGAMRRSARSRSSGGVGLLLVPVWLEVGR
jgi:hypothetical protein